MEFRYKLSINVIIIVLLFKYAHSLGTSEFAMANRNLHLRVADPRLSENITDVDKELMVDAIRQLKIKRFIRQHEGTSWNHLPQYNFTASRRAQLGVLVEDGDIVSSSAIHSSTKLLKDAYGRPRKLRNFQQVDMEELMLQSVGALQELIEINRTLVTKFLQRTTISLQYLERRVNELTGSVAYLNTSVFEETRKAREDVVRLAEVEERLVFARIEEQRNRSVEGRNLADHSHTLALVLEKERNDNENERLEKEHHLQIRVVYEKEKARRETEIEIEKIRNQTRVEAAKEAEVIAAASRIKQERENEDIRLRMLLAQAEADKKKWKEAIETAFSSFGAGFYGYLNDSKSLRTSLFVIVCIIAGMYFSREGAKLSMEEVRMWLKKKPALVRETNSTTTIGHWLAYFWHLLIKSGKPMMEGIIFDQGLDFRLRSLATSLKNTRKHGAPLRHILFHGPPGTGKTMVARRIAQNSGLDYAIMSGGDVAPLKAEAVTEIHNLMKWAKRSSRGLMLFIDEAEAFVGTRARSNQSEHLRNALNAILFHTGTQSKKFMMVLATNRPQDIDAAIIDRIDDAMAFSLPTLRERKLLCRLYFKKYISEELISSVVAQVGAGNLSVDTGATTTTTSNNDSDGGTATAAKSKSTKKTRGRGRKKKSTRAKSRRGRGASRGRSRSTSRSRRANARTNNKNTQEEEEDQTQTNNVEKPMSPTSPRGPSNTLAWAQVASRADESNTAATKLDEEKSAFDRLYETVSSMFGASSQIKIEGIYEEHIDEVAGKLEGFSGREIAKLMISLQALAYAQTNATINAEILRLLVEAKLEEHKLKELAWQSSDQYNHTLSSSSGRR